jgi:type IV pilus assembly protein PilW
VHLAELLVSIAVLGVLMSLTFATLDAGSRAHSVGAARVESQQAARVALERLLRDVRNAGLDGSGAGFPAVAVAQPARLVVQSDLDGDGRIAARGETIEWLVRDGVLRRDAGGGAQPIAPGVRRFVLEYLDGRGAVTAAPEAVRTVVVTLAAEAHDSRALVPGEHGAVYTARARIRNR